MHAGNSYPLGKTAVSGELEHLLGQCGYFRDLDPDAATGVKVQLSQMTVIARWVKNESGGTLKPADLCAWDTGGTYGPFKAVTGQAASGTTIGVGVVDPHIIGTVADNAHFWLIHFGPCRFLFTTGTALNVGDALAVGASGRVTDLDHTSLTDQLIFDRCGTALAAVAAGAASDTEFRGYANFAYAL